MNRTRRRNQTLPLHLWLILTVAAIVVTVTIAEAALGSFMTTWQQSADQSRINAVRAIIGVDAARWSDPTWQHQAATRLARLDVDLRLVRLHPGGQGTQVFITDGARALLNTGLPPTTEAQAGKSTGKARGDTTGNTTGQRIIDNASFPHTSAVTPAFQRIIIPDPAARMTEPPALSKAAVQAVPRGVAFLWLNGTSPGSPSPWLWPLAAAGAILLVLAVAIWLLGRAVLRPLAAMGRAAEGIAGGDLDVHLPPSRAREVAEVAAALEGMSATLRASLDQQSALEEQRRRLDEERKLFIGAVAHDLRTPLFMLRGYLKGLESGVAATTEKRVHYLRACRAQADALERLIADLFDYTRLEYLRQEPERAPLEFGTLLREAIEGVQPLAEAKSIALSLDGPLTPCMLLADERLLARVVNNLLDNALQHTPTGGQIVVTWSETRDSLIFAIADSGPGIAAHDLPHLFTPLYRGETSRNRKTGGAGLGLAIARRIMQAHGGELTAANGPGGGAVLTGVLPIKRSIPATLRTTTHDAEKALADSYASLDHPAPAESGSSG